MSDKVYSPNRIYVEITVYFIVVFFSTIIFEEISLYYPTAFEIYGVHIFTVVFSSMAAAFFFTIFRKKHENQEILLLEEIQKRETTEKELNSSLSLLNSTLESTNNGIVVINLQGKIVKYNQQFLTMWEISKESTVFEVDHSNPIYIIEKIKEEKIFLNNLTFLFRNPDETGTGIIELKDGRYFEWYSQPQKSDNTIIGRIWRYRDVTMSVNAKNILENSEKQFREIWEKSGEGMRLTDEKGIILLVNNAYCQLVYKDKELLIGQHFSGVYKSYEEEKKLKYEKEFNNRSIAKLIIKELLLWNDKHCWLSVNNSFVRFNNKTTVLSIFRDITETVITEQKLKASEQRLIELNASKDKFFSIVAHDLRSPFHTILLLIDALTNEYESMSKDEFDANLKDLNQLAQFEHRLLQNLLDWSRFQTGRMEFKVSEYNVREQMNAIILLLSSNARKKRIKIINDVPGSIIIAADESMMNSVFQNLINNAIKFTNPGGEITISGNVFEDHFEFSVKDTGIGIEEKDQGKMFDIRSAFSYPGTASEKGTGLGLLLCKDLIEKHGGDIRVKSIPGKGSTFTISIPFIKR